MNGFWFPKKRWGWYSVDDSFLIWKLQEVQQLAPSELPKRVLELKQKNHQRQQKQWMLLRIIKYSVGSVESGWFVNHCPIVDPSITVTAEFRTWDPVRRQPHWETSEEKNMLENVVNIYIYIHILYIVYIYIYHI